MYIGVDIGGTNLAAGLVDENLHIVASAKRRMNVIDVRELLANEIIAVADECLEKAGAAHSCVEYIGIGTPGVMDRGWGIIKYSSNIPFHNTPIRDMIQSSWDVPVFIENDAGCAAIGEHMVGAAQGYASAVVITLGTGIGGGIIIDNKLFRGIGGDGSEIGHMVIEVDGMPCSCGRKGCWEAYSSATGLKRLTAEEMRRSENSIMWELTGGEICQIGGRTPFIAAEKGDAAGCAVVNKYLKYLAAGVANMINIFRPGIVVIGGGVSNEEEKLMFDPLREIVAGECYDPSIAPPNIVKAQLGNDAGIIGAALLGLFD